MKKETHHKLVNIIAEMIESGNLTEGDRLPPERKLAEMHGVSRNTIREAIKTLAEKKVLVSKLGSGTYVAESALEILQNSLKETIEEKRHRLMEIFELRSILEPQIAALAAQRIRKDELESLEEALNRQECALIEGERTKDHDELFHRILAKASRNKILFYVYEILQDVFSESRSEELQSPSRKKTSVTIHKNIFNAVKQGDSAKASRFMAKHMNLIQQSLNTEHQSGPLPSPKKKG